MLAYLAMFGYIHQENETPLSTAITGTCKQALLSFLFTFTWQLCDSKDTNGLKNVQYERMTLLIRSILNDLHVPENLRRFLLV